VTHSLRFFTGTEKIDAAQKTWFTNKKNIGDELKKRDYPKEKIMDAGPDSHEEKVPQADLPVHFGTDEIKQQLDRVIQDRIRLVYDPPPNEDDGEEDEGEDSEDDEGDENDDGPQEKQHHTVFYNGITLEALLYSHLVLSCGGQEFHAPVLSSLMLVSLVSLTPAPVFIAAGACWVAQRCLRGK